MFSLQALMERAAKTKINICSGLSGGVWPHLAPVVFDSGRPLSPAYWLCLFRLSLSYRLKTGGAAPRQEPIACNATSCGYLASRRVFTVVDLFNRSSLVSKLQCQRAPEVIDAPLSQFAPLMNGGRLHPPHLHPFSPRMTCRLWLLSLPGIDAEILGAASPTSFHLTTQFARWCALRESRGSVLRGG